ncbi:autotransporter domain-containing protein [Burkholderia dolosa]|nr:autotransporter domain-containing protein [Burkholderia dolosa]MDN7421330.1 autotransporter domain-containing protein [Burkholderia dolosa]
MNHAYRIIWNATTGLWQVASELARSRGKGSRTSMAIAAVLCAALTEPAGAQVTGLLVGTGGAGGALPQRTPGDYTNYGNPGGDGGLGGGGGGSLQTVGGGGGGGFGGGGGDAGAGGGPTGGSAGTGMETAAGGDSAGRIGGNGATGGSAGSVITNLTQQSGTTGLNPYVIATSQSYDYVGVGGGGGGASYYNAGGAGTDGFLTVEGSNVRLSVSSGMLIGGAGGGASEGAASLGGNGGNGGVYVQSGAALAVTGTLQIGAGGGGATLTAGGTGGSGTLWVDGGSSVAVTGTLQVGGFGGGGANGGQGGNGTVTLDGGSSLQVETLVVGGTAGAGGGGTAGGAGGTGTLNLLGGSTLAFTGAAPAFTINDGGTFYVGTTGGSITGLASITNNGSINFAQSSPLTVSAAIAGSGMLNVSGTTTLTAANTYTGSTFIEGTLALTGAGSIAQSDRVYDQGTLDISGATNGVSITTLASGGAVRLGNQSLTLTAANDLFRGTISGTGGLAVDGGTETLQGNNTYTGATTIEAGATLGLAGNATHTISQSSGVTDNGTLNISATAGGASITTLAGSGVVQLGNQSLTLTHANDLFAGTIDGTGGLVLNDGTETLGGHNTYDGATIINAGTLALAGTGSIAQSAGVVDNGTLDISGTTNGASITALAGSGTVQLGSQSLTLTNASGTFSGTIAGSGGVVLTGGSQTLTGTNSYTGGTTIGAGATLRIGAAGTAGSIAGNVTDNGTLAFNRIDNVSFDGAIGGTGSVEQDGTGTLTLTGSNSYSGGTVVRAGTLSLMTSDAAGSGAITLADGTTLRFAAGLTVGNDLIIDGATTLALDSGVTVESGAISGAGSYTLTGGGTLRLTGDNSHFTGLMGLAGVTVELGSNTALGTSGLMLSGNNTLVYDTGVSISNSMLLQSGAQLVASVGENAQATQRGAITGSGSLTKAGAGTLTLTGSNTYSGQTTIDAGTLALAGTGSIAQSAGVVDNGTLDISGTTNGASITTLAGSGAVQLGSQSLRLTNASGTFSGTIAGSGGVVLTGGSQTLTGANSYTGGTTIGAGATLRIGAAGTAGSIAGNVTDNGTLAFNRIDNVSFDGAIGGTGSVEQDGTGTLTLTGSNSYSGGTALQAGTLVVGNGNALGSGTVSMSAGTTLRFGGSYTVANTITVSGDPTLDVGSGTIVTLAGAITDGQQAGDIVKTGIGTLVTTAANTYSGGTTIAAGTLQIGDGGTGGSIVGNVVDNGTLAFDRSTDLAFTGTISGAGTLDKLGGNTLTLTNDSSAFSGTTTIAAGTLSVDGKLGGMLSVGAGATLAGSGTVGSVRLASGATLSPGGAGRTAALSMAGNLTLMPGSTYWVDALPSGASDTVHVAGTATLNGGSVTVHAGDGTWNANTRYLLLDAAGGLTGSFGTVDTNLAFLQPELSYDANDVYLQLTRNGRSFASVGRTHNEIAAGAGVVSTTTTGALATALSSLDAGSAQRALDQLAGDIHASLDGVLLDDSHFVRDAAINRVRNALGVGSAGSAPLAADTARGAEPGERGAAVWSQSFGAWSRTRSDGNAASVSDATSGQLVGVDAALANGWRVGGLAGVSFGRLDDGSGNADTASYHLGLYAGRQWESVGVRVGAAYSWHATDTTREVAFGNLSNRLTSSTDARTAQLFGELGYRMQADGIVLEPYADLAYVNLHTDGFNEVGGATALAGAGSSSGATLSTLGLRASSAFVLGHVQAKATGSLGWRHAFGPVATESQVRFDGGSLFQVTGLPLARDAATLDTGVEFALTRDVSARVSYAGQYGARYHEHAVQGHVTWTF